jgi:hypothetical protein
MTHVTIERAKMEQVLEALGKSIAITMADIDLRHKAITTIKQALAAQHEPENEPHVSLASVREDWGPGPHEYYSLPSQPAPVQPVQEPEIVQRVKRYAGQTMRTARNPNITARECIELANWIVATPPAAKRQWVGLTVLEQADCFANTEDATEFYHAIEAKLKEKNT